MLIIKNIGLAVFKVKFTSNTPDYIRDKVNGVATKNATITIPSDCVDYIDLPHIRRCERNRAIQVYSIRDKIVTPVKVAAKPKKGKAKTTGGAKKPLKEAVTNA